LELIDFERRGEYVLADVKSATWFFECRSDPRPSEPHVALVNLYRQSNCEPLE
jgi:hypothetical protein